MTMAVPRRAARQANHRRQARQQTAHPRVCAETGRRAALLDLAGQLPAAVLAGLLGLAPATAVKWMRQAGGDWSRYAAELARTRDHRP